MLGLVECGTHAVVAAAIAPYGHSEVAMAAELLPPKLTADMLVMADRNFYSFKLWHTAGYVFTGGTSEENAYESMGCTSAKLLIDIRLLKKKAIWRSRVCFYAVGRNVTC